METILRLLALSALYAGLQCFALLIGGALIRFADYEFPEPEWRRALLAGLVSAVGVIILDAVVQTNLHTLLEIRRAEHTLHLGTLIILLACHRYVYRSGDVGDMIASGAILMALCMVSNLIIPLQEKLHPWTEQKRAELEVEGKIENLKLNDS